MQCVWPRVWRSAEPETPVSEQTQLGGEVQKTAHRRRHQLARRIDKIHRDIRQREIGQQLDQPARLEIFGHDETRQKRNPFSTDGQRL